MAIRAKLSMIGIIAASFIAGLVFYYLASSHDRVQKKKYIEDMVSLLIHFIIYIWIGKIAVNFLLFIRDPIAVLAYPSNSKALYVAVVLMILTIFYQHYRNKRIFQFDVFIPVFFAASFVYEFIHILLNGITFEWAYLGLLLLLLIVYLLYIEGALARELSYLLFNIWSFGILIISLLFPFATIFHYIVSPIFLAIVFCLSVFLTIRIHKREME